MNDKKVEFQWKKRRTEKSVWTGVWCKLSPASCYRVQTVECELCIVQWQTLRKILQPMTTNARVSQIKRVL